MNQRTVSSTNVKRGFFPPSAWEERLNEQTHAHPRHVVPDTGLHSSPDKRKLRPAARSPGQCAWAAPSGDTPGSGGRRGPLLWIGLFSLTSFTLGPVSKGTGPSPWAGEEAGGGSGTEEPVCEGGNLVRERQLCARRVLCVAERRPRGSRTGTKATWKGTGVRWLLLAPSCTPEC